MANRITEKFVKLAPNPDKTRIFYDDELKGFGLRVTQNGARSFVLNYRAAGRERRLTIGSYPEWSAVAARKQAEELKRRIDLGSDPLADRHSERAAPTVGELCTAYETRHLPRKRPSSQRHDRSYIRRVIRPRFGTWKASKLTHADIESMHRELSAVTPAAANRVVALLSKMFALAIKWGYVEQNPARGIERNPEHHRERYLQEADLQRLSEALDAYARQDVANAIRLLLLTGARRSEVLSAKWGQFDLENAVWSKPKEGVKQKRLHRVPLSQAAVHLLKMMQNGKADDFLFPSTGETGHLIEVKKGWSAIKAAARIDDFRLHDLRHTYASHLASVGYSLPIIGALLGHSQPATTARYAHLLDRPLREATDAVSDRLAGRRR